MDCRKAIAMNNNSGHGYVVRRDDGFKARCGGPAICSKCAEEVKVLQNKFIEIYAKPKLKNLLELEAQGELPPFGKVEILVLTDWIEDKIKLPHNFSVLLPLFKQYMDDFVHVQQLVTETKERSPKTFEIFDNPPRIKCLECNRTSYSREDVRQKYCVGCDKFHDDYKKRIGNP